MTGAVATESERMQEKSPVAGELWSLEKGGRSFSFTLGGTFYAPLSCAKTHPCCANSPIPPLTISIAKNESGTSGRVLRLCCYCATSSWRHSRRASTYFQPRARGFSQVVAEIQLSPDCPK